MVRIAVTVRGVVQGVGFRPFVHAAATRRGLSGWVRNRRDGIAIEVQGGERRVRDFLAALRREAPAAARVEGVEVVDLPPAPADGFRILPSADDREARATLPADLGVCAACSAEIETPGARRHGYPFANCAGCGPRYTIIEALPYDRARTAMRAFAPCADCAREYGDPADRRFHAQPIACPACGPSLRLLARDGAELARGEEALAGAIAALRDGGIAAVKGLGGFQLLADATSPAAVARLRQRKRRPDKPLAVLFPSLAAVREVCATSPAEEAWLASSESPILLLARRREPRRPAAPHHGEAARGVAGEPGGGGHGALPGGVATSRDAAGERVAEDVAPGNPHLGAMLPYTPLHRRVAAAAGRPLVCTSGNLAQEPICIDDGEALARLSGIADVFLAHDRRIVRPVDDSVARAGDAGLEILRRARGFAPLPLAVPGMPPGIVALGAQQKSTVAVTLAGTVVVSQHLGDLGSAEAAALLERTALDLVRLFDVRPRVVACDLHPDYVSTRLAERLASDWGAALERVQHHHAHVAACAAEHGVGGPVLGLAWDGAGLGVDGVLWGGEALVVDGAGFRRVAHLHPFALPGGERAMREPRRAALGALYEVARERARSWAGRAFSPAQVPVLLGMLEGGVGSPRTTSVGRLFDAVAAIAGLRAVATFEGQAAMELEHAADGADDAAAACGDEARAYPLPLGAGEPAVADWRPLLAAVVEDCARGVAAAVVSARFHAALAGLAEAIAARAGIARVALGGGCFQNRRLARAVRARLAARGHQVLAPRLYPPNDGAIALGQAAVAAARRNEEGTHVPRGSW